MHQCTFLTTGRNIFAFILHTHSHKHPLSDLHPLLPLKGIQITALGPPTHIHPWAAQHTLSRHIPQPCPSTQPWDLRLGSSWTSLLSRPTPHTRTHTLLPSCRSALGPLSLQTEPNPMGSSIVPPVSPFSCPQTGTIFTKSLLPGSADKVQSQEMTLMSFEQEGTPPPEASGSKAGRKGLQRPVCILL